MKKLKVILISCLCLLMMTGCTTNKIDNQKIKIVCTTYVQYDWLQQIIGKENSTFDLSLIIKMELIFIIISQLFKILYKYLQQIYLYVSVENQNHGSMMRLKKPRIKM